MTADTDHARALEVLRRNLRHDPTHITLLPQDYVALVEIYAAAVEVHESWKAKRRAEIEGKPAEELATLMERHRLAVDAQWEALAAVPNAVLP